VSECPVICVDASVAAKWFLRHEPGAEHAAVLLERFAEGTICLVAPELLIYELGNVLSRAARYHQVPAATALALAAEVERLGLTLVRASGEMRSVLAFSLRLGISHYDAAYLAAAESAGATLVTFDAQLRAAAAAAGLDWVADPASLVGPAPTSPGARP